MNKQSCIQCLAQSRFLRVHIQNRFEYAKYTKNIFKLDKALNILVHQVFLAIGFKSAKKVRPVHERRKNNEN